MGYTPEEIRDWLRDFTKAPIMAFFAKVKSVDETKNTCEVLPEDDGAPLPDVYLKAELSQTSGIVEVPELNSIVICCIVNNDPDTAFVAKTSKVKKIVINGGVNDGIVKVIPLVSFLNGIVSDITTLKGLLATLATTGSAATTAPLVGSAVSPFAAYAASPITATTKESLSNSKVTH